MEPLGSAYAAPSPSATPVREETAVVSSPAAAAVEGRADATVEGMLPSVLRGKTISLDTLSATATASERVAVAKDKGTVAINAMSGDGLPHADMEEWLIFSDLHVGPGSLDVGLEVSRRAYCDAGFSWLARGHDPARGETSVIPSSELHEYVG